MSNKITVILDKNSPKYIATTLLSFAVLSIIVAHFLVKAIETNLFPGMQISYTKNFIIFSLIGFVSCLILISQLFNFVNPSKEKNANPSNPSKTKEIVTLLDEQADFNSSPSKSYLIAAGIIWTSIISAIIYFINNL